MTREPKYLITIATTAPIKEAILAHKYLSSETLILSTIYPAIHTLTPIVITLKTTNLINCSLFPFFNLNVHNKLA